MVTIAVAGTATRSVAPERGTVVVGVAVIGDDRSAITARVARAHAVLTAEAAGHQASGAATRWNAQDVTAGTVLQWEKGPDGSGRHVSRFCASASVEVRFADFAVLGAWVLEVAERGDHEVRGVEWDLTDATRRASVEEVRAAATRDAVARATTYAHAAHLGEPRLLALYEDGLRPSGGSGALEPYPVRRMAPMGDAGSASPESLDLHPADIELTVGITADFEAD